VFWPQDAAILAVGLLIFLTGIAVFTAAYGRLWCGWVCPQTVLMELVFRKIEYAIEGDPQSQRALDRAPWSAGKLARKLAKHGLFLALSFVVGNTLLAYIIGSDALLRIVTDNPMNHMRGLSFMILFTLVFYGIFARFREQACTFICPYGRLQSTLLDDNSIVVAYDHKRGEQRAPLRARQEPETRRAAGHGDCVDCHQCVAVCPTGIDIRHGTQMECVHCTACMDACDSVMDRIGRPRGLIRYASLAGIERGERLRFTPRLAGYTALLATLIGLETFLVFSRADVEATLLRAPGSLYQTMPDGRIGNLYLLKLINKSAHDVPVQLRLESPEGGTLRVMGRELVVPAEKLAQTSVLIELPPAHLAAGTAGLTIEVRSGDRRLQTLRTRFIGPRGSTP
jgi:cytochrome c oxidase accessory protein FixG